MAGRFLYIWFRHLTTDWMALRKPELKDLPFVFAEPTNGRLMVTAASSEAEKLGISPELSVADSKAIIPDLLVLNEKTGRAVKLLKAIGEWCIRYTPIVAIDPPEGLILDISGCAHLWGGEREYFKSIIIRLKEKGYDVKAAIADTVGAAWAIAHFGKVKPIIEPHELSNSLLSLPPAALRLDKTILLRLAKLGLNNIMSFIGMPRSVLRRRFGDTLILRLSQALNQEEEPIQPLKIPSPYQERLPCLEPIRTAAGIEIAISRLLNNLCERLKQEGKGIRKIVLRCYRVDGRMVQIEIGTNSPSNNQKHLLKLFELKIPSIEPALGIELFIIEGMNLEDITTPQEILWSSSVPSLNNPFLAELLDRIAGKVGAASIRRYLPQAHYWPERSLKITASLLDKPEIPWNTNRPRPTQLLSQPEHIEVTAPVPDYPPMLFRYKGKLHHIKKADGPERIEREWWLEQGDIRDYYQVEDEHGSRYWLFRSGRYSEDQDTQWFIHGFFA